VLDGKKYLQLPVAIYCNYIHGNEWGKNTNIGFSSFVKIFIHLQCFVPNDFNHTVHVKGQSQCSFMEKVVTTL
jgi:hypothetical protein